MNAPPPHERSVRVLGAVLAVLLVLLAALLVWWAAGGADDGEEQFEASPEIARVVGAAELREAASGSPVPVYWAGERPGAELELSEAGADADGGEASRAYVRYLTAGAEAGDPEPAYLTVGTYELPAAFAALQANAKRTGAKLRKAPRGFRAWQDPASPTSVYLAKPGAEYQVEVYDPNPKEALKAALSPDIQPVPTG